MGFRACTCNPMVCAVLSSNAPLKSHRHHHCFSTPHRWAYGVSIAWNMQSICCVCTRICITSREGSAVHVELEGLRGELCKRLGMVCSWSALNVFHLSECHLSLSSVRVEWVHGKQQLRPNKHYKYLIVAEQSAKNICKLMSWRISLNDHS